ncbi:MAG TPA: Holliday junction resolvase RuvX [Acholeplasmataceae bacterium]|nr:Holliday junction resolvase RuvX [Acholeplasmataceae bacterium]
MKKYLGLDLGSKTLGVAISESGIIATALETYRFSENKYEDAVAMLIKLSDTYKIDTIVLGFPKHMNNDIGIRGRISEDFKKMIEEKKQVEVVLWDERLSTKTALRAMIKGSERRDTQKSKKDELAAVVILQNYLDYKGASLC